MPAIMFGLNNSASNLGGKTSIDRPVFAVLRCAHGVDAGSLRIRHGSPELFIANALC